MSTTHSSYTDISSLHALIENKVLESKEIEYKDYVFTDGKINEKHKDKLIKEIVAFANANGGTIIIGMQEDENRLPVRLNGTGISIKDFDDWLSSFRQLVLARIRPHLHGIECHPVAIEDDSLVVVINIPKSYARPHSFWDGNKDEFYIRYANGISYMDIDDLRKGFLYSSGIQTQIRQFCKDRISMILSNECVGDLGDGAKIVFFILPEWSLELGNTIDLSIVEKNVTLFLPISGYGCDSRYNADGYCIFANNFETETINSYVQIFHNGIIEAVEIRLFSLNNMQEVYNWFETVKIITDSIKRYCNLLDQSNVPKPWHISSTILNGKGYYAKYGLFNSSKRLERDIINSQDGIITEDISIDEALKPVFSSLSNAFGLRSSPSCDVK